MARKKRPSAVEVSPHRRDIEEMILEGKSDRFIADWLISVGEKISYGAVFNYRKNKFNVKEEAVKNYNEKKSKERKTKAVNKVVSDIEYCDNIIDLANKVSLQVDHEHNITELDIKKLGLQSIKVKQEIFKAGTEDEKEFTIKIVGVDNDGESDNLETES